MTRNPVVWFEIYVQDLQRAKSFYQAVLQQTLEQLHSPDLEMWAFPARPEAAGSGGALVKMDGVDSGGGGTLIYFACEDCAVEESRVVASGGRVQRAKWSVGPYGFISLAVDPEGNLFGLHSLR